MIEQMETDITSSANTADLEFAAPEKQKARAFLRERFLRVITGIVGKQTEFYLHENTRVLGEFRGCDVECSEIFARNLKTPMGTIPEAILRNGDIIYLDIGDINID
ncbi:gem-associated protein 7-like [Formica exsecta]|uniref:gem-associated protein 7-like n=1 Tax=Formica exsecta TaxID=72781 RepID=UPI001143A58D|nr:gem-associated protein 7-like [Formica exsecta]XP_029661881.1 gem-associated protein 7-like [Formica exsecta]XP_029661882.1 gem-associated protein 7-like [Formica exsecta]XP_029661883.1 gem-associated protein 7-like [Formica exsecta]